MKNIPVEDEVHELLWKLRVEHKIPIQKIIAEAVDEWRLTR